jgi:hypothetical protein
MMPRKHTISSIKLIAGLFLADAIIKNRIIRIEKPITMLEI